VRRLLRKLRRKGDRAVIHELRGRASNRRLPAELEQRAIAVLSGPVYRGIWADSGRGVLAQAAPNYGEQRDAAGVDGESGGMESRPSARGGSVPVAAAAEPFGRVDAVEHQHPRLAGGPRRAPVSDSAGPPGERDAGARGVQDRRGQCVPGGRGSALVEPDPGRPRPPAPTGPWEKSTIWRRS
jgi:hypothetical protein